MGRGVICSFTYSMSLDPLAFAEMDVVRTIEGFFLGGFCALQYSLSLMLVAVLARARERCMLLELGEESNGFGDSFLLHAFQSTLRPPRQEMALMQVLI